MRCSVGSEEILVVSLVFNVTEPGQLVDVRQRRYVVVDVAQSVLPPDLLKSGSLSSRFQHDQYSIANPSCSLAIVNFFCLTP